MKTATRSPTRRQTHLSLEVLESRFCLSTYSIVNLLPPAGNNYSLGLALNDQGLVVGRTAVSGFVRAVSWEVGAGTTASGTLLPVLAGGVASDAYDANNSDPTILIAILPVNWTDG